MRWRELTPRTARVSLAVAAVAACLAGCGDSRPVPVKVRGQVLLGENPVPGAQVTFHPTAKTTPEILPVGKTDAEGWYELTTFAEKDGAPAGEYKVAVTRFQAVKAGDEFVSRNTLPPRYAQPESSGLTASVKKGAAELEPLQVTAK